MGQVSGPFEEDVIDRFLGVNMLAKTSATGPTPHVGKIQ
tara:strand:+ start:964 stop:1080 length:117 start_codon:yes stop_codon:yes gene_type:complete